MLVLDSLDFGPVNLAIVTRFCRAMGDKVSKLAPGASILYCIEPAFAPLANASFLLAAFGMLCYRYTVDEAAEPFLGPDAPFPIKVPSPNPTPERPHRCVAFASVCLACTPPPRLVHKSSHAAALFDVRQRAPA